MKKPYPVLVFAIIATILLTACGARNATAVDLLSDIKARGYILVSTDVDHAPESFLNNEGQRPEQTKCPSTAMTTAEIQGFDIDVAAELAKRLGVEPCFAAPRWNTIIAGKWGDKWDISVGSMTITADRQQVLSFTTAYYYRPAVVGVTKDSGITSLTQLSGKVLCVAGGSLYEDWLKGKLKLPPQDIYAQPPPNVGVLSLDTDQECAQEIQNGGAGVAGYVSSAAVVKASIANGLAVVEVDGPVFAENLAVAIDKSHTKDTSRLVSTLDGIVKQMHADGTLSTLSQKWFQADLTQTPTK